VELAAAIGEKLGVASEFLGGIAWQERDRLLDRGEIHVCWICGLPYVKKRREQSTIDLLAAPVMKAPRYRAQPIYYSDVLVHADSRFTTFEDLRGARWAYNEPGSHSGYGVTRYQLAVGGFGSGYFGEVVASGSHQQSLELLLRRAIDATAIDSTVLDLALAGSPELAPRIRAVATWGPSPAPPWVVHQSVPSEMREALRREFLTFDRDAAGRQLLDAAGMLGFADVTDREYDAIREMERVGAAVELR